MEPSSKPRRFSAVLLKVIASLCLLVGTAQAAEPTTSSPPNPDPSIQKVLSDLEKAYQERDYGIFNTGKPEEKPLTWGECESSGGTHLSFNETVKRLTDPSKGATIYVNEMTLNMLDTVSIETKGWPGDYPYIYFYFRTSFPGWRWLGVAECETRDSDFQLSLGDDELGTDFTKRKKRAASLDPGERSVINAIQEAVKTHNFYPLKSHVPKQRIFELNDCGPGDMAPWELYFDDFQKVLLEDSIDTTIYINPEFDYSNGWLSIETEGWAGEYPYFIFNFSFIESENNWQLDGGCTSNRPVLRQPDSGYSNKVAYFRAPDLPRPGPRVFNDENAFHARIKEIIHFKAFEALGVYAIRGSLYSAECGKEISEENPNVEQIPIEKVIERLSKNAEGSTEFQFRPLYGSSGFLMSSGWSLDPYVYFGFTKTPEGLEWTKVAFCKNDLIQDIFMKPPLENTGPHTPLLQHRLIQVGLGFGLALLIVGILVAFRNKKGREGDLEPSSFAFRNKKGREGDLEPSSSEPTSDQDSETGKNKLAGVIGIVLILCLVILSVWAFGKALTLEETARSSQAEIQKFQLIQHASLAGVVIVLIGLIFLSRKKKGHPTTVSETSFKPNERVQKFLGKGGSTRHRVLLELVPGLGQAAAGRTMTAVFSAAAIPFVWGVLFLIYGDLEGSYFSFPFFPAVPTLLSAGIAIPSLIWVWIAVDGVRLNNPKPLASYDNRLGALLTLPLVPITAGMVTDIFLGSLDDNLAPLMFGWGGASAGLFGVVAWRIHFGFKKTTLFVIAGFAIGLFCRFSRFALPLPIETINVYPPLVGGFLIGLFIFIFFIRLKGSLLFIPAAMGWSWVWSLVNRILPRPEMTESTSKWVESIVYHGPTLFNFYFIGLAILWVVENLNPPTRGK